MLKNGYSGAIGFCLILTLSLPIESVIAQESVAGPVALTETTDPYSKSSRQVASDEALRAQLAHEGLLQVRVDLRLPEIESQGPEEVAHAGLDHRLVQDRVPG